MLLLHVRQLPTNVIAYGSHPCKITDTLCRCHGTLNELNSYGLYDGKIFGVGSLRVVDASTFPLLPLGHCQATVCKYHLLLSDAGRQRTTNKRVLYQMHLQRTMRMK